MEAPQWYDDLNGNILLGELSAPNTYYLAEIVRLVQEEYVFDLIV